MGSAGEHADDIHQKPYIITKRKLSLTKCTKSNNCWPVDSREGKLRPVAEWRTRGERGLQIVIYHCQSVECRSDLSNVQVPDLILIWIFKFDQLRLFIENSQVTTHHSLIPPLSTIESCHRSGSQLLNFTCSLITTQDYAWWTPSGGWAVWPLAKRLWIFIFACEITYSTPKILNLRMQNFCVQKPDWGYTLYAITYSWQHWRRAPARASGDW
jgi:hypothetical protein